MVQNVALFIMVVSVVGMFGCLAQIVRLHFWSKFIGKQIDYAYEQRVGGNKEARWPAVGPSYDNFKWYQPFNYNFKSMIVYE